MTQAIAHAANVGSGLVGHQLRRMVAEAMGRLTDALQATLDGIARQTVPPESVTVHIDTLDFHARTGA